MLFVALNLPRAAHASDVHGATVTVSADANVSVDEVAIGDAIMHRHTVVEMISREHCTRLPCVLHGGAPIYESTPVGWRNGPVIALRDASGYTYHWIPPSLDIVDARVRASPLRMVSSLMAGAGWLTFIGSNVAGLMMLGVARSPLCGPQLFPTDPGCSRELAGSLLFVLGVPVGFASIVISGLVKDRFTHDRLELRPVLSPLPNLNVNVSNSGAAVSATWRF
jgi:hypothetical protein